MTRIWVGVLFAPLLAAQVPRTGRAVTPEDLARRQTSAPRETATEEVLVRGRVQLEGSVVKAGPDRVSLRPATRDKAVAAAPEVLVTGAPALAELAVRPSDTFSILADQRRHGGGIASALKLRDRAGLQFLSERILDQPLLSAADRDGWVVAQRPSGTRTFVFEDRCKTVYNVPTTFRMGERSWELSAHQTQVVEAGGARYKLALNQSRFVVLKPCPIPFEGGRSDVEYTIVRERAATAKGR